MGDVISMRERLADRSRPRRDARPAFFFDLACPFSYLAAERVERLLGEVDWVPAAAAELGGGKWSEPDQFRAHAEQRALELRLPLVWPERFPADSSGALRAAAHASEIGACCRFALAASRLAFCGGFDLEDPVILAEASAAAALPLEDCLRAASDPRWDEQLHATGRGLLMRGVRELPAIRVGRSWFEGERPVAAAATMLRSQAHAPAPASADRLIPLRPAPIG